MPLICINQVGLIIYPTCKFNLQQVVAATICLYVSSENLGIQILMFLNNILHKNLGICIWEAEPFGWDIVFWLSTKISICCVICLTYNELNLDGKASLLQ